MTIPKVLFWKNERGPGGALLTPEPNGGRPSLLSPDAMPLYIVDRLRINSKAQLSWGIKELK